MDIEVSPLTAIAAVAAFLLGPATTALVDAWWGEARRRSLTLSFAVSLLAAVCWFIAAAVTAPELEPLLTFPLGGLAGFAAVLATIPVRDRSAGAVLSFSALFALAVFTPVTIAVLSVTDGLIGASLRTLDLGGALPVLVASGCAGGAILFAERRSPSDSPGRSRRFVAPIFALVWILWVAWLVGVELVVDQATPAIVANAIIAPIAATAVWLIVQRVRHAKTTSVGAIGGLFCGLVAITAGCGFLNPLGAALTGAIASAVCSLVGYGVVRRLGRAEWLLVVVLVGAASIGVILLGGLATRSGLMFTGQPEVLFSQVASVIAVIAYSTVVSLILWLAVRSAASALQKRRSISRRA